MGRGQAYWGDLGMDYIKGPLTPAPQPLSLVDTDASKSEIRRPKAERRPKSEARTPKRSPSSGESWHAWNTRNPEAQHFGSFPIRCIRSSKRAFRILRLLFGFRPSGFFRVSAFGFRISTRGSTKLNGSASRPSPLRKGRGRNVGRLRCSACRGPLSRNQNVAVKVPRKPFS